MWTWEAIKIKALILVEGQQEAEHLTSTEETPRCLPRPPPSPYVLSPFLSCLLTSLSLPQPICSPPLSFPLLPPLFFFPRLLVVRVLPPSCRRPPSPPLHPSTDRESSIFIVQTHVLFWQWGLWRSERKESSNPSWQQTHIISGENTPDHQLRKPVRVHQRFGYQLWSLPSDSMIRHRWRRVESICRDNSFYQLFVCWTTAAKVANANHPLVIY